MASGIYDQGQRKFDEILKNAPIFGESFSEKKKVAICCVLDRLGDAYSLTNVIVEQAKMLALHGYPTELWLLEDWTLARDAGAQALLAEYPEIVIRPVLPRILLYDYADVTKPTDDYAEPGDPCPSIEEKAKRIAMALAPCVAAVDVVLCHDLLFQTWYLPHGLALRQVATQAPHARFLHWQHSGPSAVPKDVPWPHLSRFAPMLHSRFVFLNEDQAERERVAEMRAIPARDLAFVPNTRDPLEYFEAPAEVKRYVRSRKLLEAEVLMVLPARLDAGKQPEKALMLLAAMIEQGFDAHLVWCAAYASPEEARHRKMLDQLWQAATALGIPRFALHFTNEHAPWKEQCPRDCVRAFQQIADFFVLPSLSEAHSLVAMEAALCRNILILNEDFPPMRTWFPEGSTYRLHFSSRLQQSRFGAEGEDECGAARRYYREAARKIIADLAYNPMWRAFSHQRRKHNLVHVFKRFLEPLIWSF